MQEEKCMLPPYFINNENPVMTFSQTIDWGLRTLKIPELHARGITGKGVRVGVLDTGVDIDHPDLKVATAKDYTKSGTPEDTVGHGTHVAGIIAAQGNNHGVLGVAPGVSLHVYKVLAKNSGNLMDVANGIRAAADEGMHIINMSLGSPANVPYVHAAIQYAASKGVILVVSSGNSGKEQKFYPSSYKECYATGSIDSRLKVSSFSTYGAQLEFVAPGSKILSTYLNGSYAVLSGTSMAAPFAAGCIALMKQAGVMLNYHAITKSVIDIEDPNYDKLSGYGIIDPNIAIVSSNQVDKGSAIKEQLGNISHSVDTIMGMLDE